MKVGEIPYEYLSEHQRDAYGVCKEVFLDQGAKMFQTPFAVDIRAQAEHLFVSLNQMEECDDRYYQIVNLTVEVKKLIQKALEYKHTNTIPFNPADGTPSEIAAQMMRFAGDTSNEDDACVVYRRRYISPDVTNRFRGDFVSIQIYTDNILFREVYDYKLLKGTPHAEYIMADERLKRLKGRNERHYHTEKVIEYWLRFPDCDRETLALIIEDIQATPRKAKTKWDFLWEAIKKEIFI